MGISVLVPGSKKMQATTSVCLSLHLDLAVGSWLPLAIDSGSFMNPTGLKVRAANYCFHWCAMPDTYRLQPQQETGEQLLHAFGAASPTELVARRFFHASFVCLLVRLLVCCFCSFVRPFFSFDRFFRSFVLSFVRSFSHTFDHSFANRIAGAIFWPLVLWIIVRQLRFQQTTKRQPGLRFPSASRR